MIGCHHKKPMTVPIEEYFALKNTHAFLVELASTPKIPKNIKQKALICLKHYPTSETLHDLYEEYIPNHPSRF